MLYNTGGRTRRKDGRTSKNDLFDLFNGSARLLDRRSPNSMVQSTNTLADMTIASLIKVGCTICHTLTNKQLSGWHKSKISCLHR